MTAVVVTENGQGRYQQTVVAGEHRFLADEPAAMGGGNKGPAPFDFILAGLGACTSMTLRMYAERKDWPLTGIAVHLHHETQGTADGPRPHIQREIRLDGPLTDTQRNRLLEIALRCPVHRALSQSFSLTAKLATNCENP